MVNIWAEILQASKAQQAAPALQKTLVAVTRSRLGESGAKTDLF